MKKIILFLAALTIGSALFAANPSNEFKFDLKFNKENSEGARAFAWPFTAPSVKDFSSSVKTPTFVGEEVVLKYKEKDGVVYEFKAYGVGGILKNSVGGLLIMGGPGSYLEFPAVAGKTLKGVKMVAGQKNATEGAIDVRDAEGKSVSEQGAQGVFEAYDEIEWTTPNAEEGKAYRLINFTKRQISLAELTIEYK